jgi:predicted Fe-Mo cluster-binding NifX family protein
MKIVISTDNNLVSAHFGRCPHFTIVDIIDGKLQDRATIDNPGHSPGFLPQFFADKGIECIIAGGMGVKAQSLFVQYGIETVLGVTGDVDSVIQKILDGTLEGGKSLCDRASGKHKECNHHNENT